MVHVEKAWDLMAAEVDCLDVDLGSVRLNLGVVVGVVVGGCEEH